MSTAENKAVFLSYASQDAEAARRICEALRASGVEVWFDQNELRGGDAWDAKIRRQIKECALFVPVISANTNARPEGYFRLEWKLAVDRSHLMSDDHPFLFPVVIDETADATARVPDKFREVQWTRLNVKDTPESLANRVARMLGAVAAQSSLPASGWTAGEGPALRRRGGGARWIAWTMGIAGVLVGLLAVLHPWWPAPHPSPTSAPAAAAPTEARRLADQARALLLKPSGGPGKYETAALLCDRALTLDPTDANVWGIASQVDTMFASNAFDESQKRVASAQSKALRAINLAPDAFEARLAEATFQALLGGQPVASAAEATLRALRAENPRDVRVLNTLTKLLREQGRGPEALAFADEAARLPDGAVISLTQKAWVARGLWRFDEADAALDQSIALEPIAGAVGLKVFLDLSWRGDPDRALATLKKLPADELTMDVGVAAAVRLYRWRREPGEVLRFLRAVPHDWLTWGINGPKAALTGDANAELHRSEAARADWQTALALVEQRLAATPNDRELLEWKAYLQASLGERTAAQATWQRAQELSTPSMPALLNVERISRVVPPDQVLDELERRVNNAIEHLASHQQSSIQFISAADLRLNPAWDGVRSLPRFQVLQARLDADPRFNPNAKAGGAPTADAKSAVSDKSVAVLAFSDLSEKHDSEYFSDGISEELLNVLAKIPELKVSARTSAFSFKGKEVPISEIARQLGVAYVVEGSVRKAGNKVRITAQLIQAADGFHVWSDDFDRELKDIFAVQDEIAGLIAKNLELKLGTRRPARAVNPEAYALMLRGQAVFNRGMPDDYPQGIQYYKDSLALDHDSALAWASLAVGYAVSVAQGAAPADATFALARESAQHALALDPDLASAHYALGMAEFLADWDWAQAAAELQRALVLAPNDVNVIASAATVAQTRGEAERGLELARKAVSLDPLAFTPAYSLAKSLMQTGRWVEMEQQAAKMIAANPASRYGYLFLTFAHLLQGHTDAAAQACAPMKPDLFGSLCVALVRNAQGRSAESDAVIAEMEAKFATHGCYQIAEAYAYRKQPDRAFAWLDKAIRTRDAGLTWTGYDPFLNNLHADPRWVPFLQRLNLPTPPP